MIIVTPTETRLITEFEQAGISIVKQNLLVGDVQILKNGTDIVEYIIERKAGGDLEASIKDGRYKEQKTRLTSLGYDQRRIIFLIENFPKTSNMEKSLWSSITNSYHRDGFGIFGTKNIAESVKFITSLDKSATEHAFYTPPSTSCPPPAPSQNDDDPSTPTPSTPPNNNNLLITETQIRKRRVVPDDYFLNTLMLIPGVNEVAFSVVDTYKTLSELKTAFTTHPFPEIMLENIQRKNKKMRIGPAMSKKIYEYVNKL